ncbi:lipid II flippase MurJ [Nonomuraea roseoviolacea subsp. roseoviolacea]|uniref:Peptidoglycan lipid II flippase n=1 Tax=Nonomuraea roseoviolacea subsp. carminata TaxID=160689 RepID=A0ABT1K9U3_9ACTN|nr:lipid II flippase MurJ [Nonomuraea roseoviolacea]MCP2350792.1 putative peptidoglycan lipid II flippase [Nonomuraea roseoviolacea subsp. carminata]
MTARLARGVAGGAMLIGAITILARVAGFAKQYAFARTVGTNCLASAYFTANQIPNIIFEVVVGGALAGMVVPVLAGTATSQDDGAGRARVEAISSALLTWVLLVLVPLGALTALLAGPLVEVFFGAQVKGCDLADIQAVAARMLVVFAPQIPLYGVAVVLYGVLQAHKRFAGPALAPLVSSIVVIVAYLLFVPLSGGWAESGDARAGLSALPGPAELALSVGTSLGVLALVLTVVGPIAGLGLRWRPSLRFPPGVAVQVRRLALAGVAALLAQQAAMVVVLLLANKAVGTGAIAVYNYAWAIYLVPYAVLAVPIATSAFPRLSARAEAGETQAFADLAAGATRAVVIVSGLAAGVLAATSEPGAAVFLWTKSEVRPDELARTIALFAPGLVGYGLIAHLSRVLYAAGRGRAAATGTVAGWLVVMVAQTVFALTFPDGWRIAGMALGMSVGMTAGGVLLLVSVVRVRGRGAAAGLGRAGAAAVAGGLAGYLAGAGVVAVLGAESFWGQIGAVLAGAVAALAAGGLVVALVDRADATAVAGTLVRARRG